MNHWDDIIRLAALERARSDKITQQLRAGTAPLGMTLAPWRGSMNLLAYNVQIATGVSTTADHNMANDTPITPLRASSFFGDAFLFEAVGTSDFAASATLNFWIKIGATKVQTASVALPSTAATGKRWDLNAICIIKTTGVSGTAMVQIWGTHESLSTPYRFSANLIASPTTSTINTTVPPNIALGMNWSASSASNNCRCDATWLSKIGNADG